MTNKIEYLIIVTLEYRMTELNMYINLTMIRVQLDIIFGEIVVNVKKVFWKMSDAVKLQLIMATNVWLQMFIYLVAMESSKHLHSNLNYYTPLALHVKLTRARERTLAFCNSKLDERQKRL